MQFRLCNQLRRSVLAKRRRSDPRSQHASVRLYGVGLPKTGTVSLAAMFADAVAAMHEPEAIRTINLILDRAAGNVSRRSMRRVVKQRDLRLRLCVDSSQLNGHLIEALVDAFPAARFVLTVRDCYSWLDSLINHSLNRQCSAAWKVFRDYRFRPDIYPHSRYESLLQQRGLYSLDGYFSYWARHNEEVLSTVPPHRLLVVRTDQLDTNACRIAEFAGLSSTCVNLTKTHRHRSRTRHYLLRKLDCGYLEAKAEQHCGRLMRQFFPAIRCF